jgi:mRNA interferase MazF
MPAPPNPRRGEIWWVTFDPAIGSEIKKTRTAVVVSSDSIRFLPVRIVVPFTEWKSKHEDRPWAVRVEPSPLNGLEKVVAADAMQIRCMAAEATRFHQYIGSLEAELLEEVAAAVALIVEYVPLVSDKNS